MKKLFWQVGVVFALLLMLAFVGIQPSAADNTPTPEPPKPVTPISPQPSMSASPEVVKHGQYLVESIGCGDCHTNIDQNTGLPLPGVEFAGARPFPLDPAGNFLVFSRNITSDPETGIGNWTDDEIKHAITMGVDRDGQRLFPVMPYLYFNTMADADLDAIVAYVRTIKPVMQVVPPNKLPPGVQYPPVPERKPGIVAPDPKDTPARAKYLMTSLLTCGDCHTPLDQKTGLPDMSKYLAGGQPFEGPWGVVYGGNITPDKKTGLGNWSDDEIRNLIKTGVRPDGRQAIVMPWQVYTHLTDDDIKAVIYYLRNDLPAVENEVPAAALKGAPAPTPAPAAGGGSQTTLIVVAVIAVLVVGGGLIFFSRRGKPSGGQ